MNLDKLITHIGAKVEELLRDYQGSLQEAIDGASVIEPITVSFAAKIKPLSADANAVVVSISFITAKVKANTESVVIDEKQLPLSILKAARDIAPERGSNVSEVIISSNVDGKKESVTLTPETKERLDEEIRREG